MSVKFETCFCRHGATSEQWEQHVDNNGLAVLQVLGRPYGRPRNTRRQRR